MAVVDNRKRLSDGKNFFLCVSMHRRRLFETSQLLIDTYQRKKKEAYLLSFSHFSFHASILGIFNH